MRTAVLVLVLVAEALAVPLAETQGNAVSGRRHGVYTGGKGINFYGGGGSNLVATSANIATGTGNDAFNAGNQFNSNTGYSYTHPSYALAQGGGYRHAEAQDNKVSTGAQPKVLFMKTLGTVKVEYIVEYPDVNECPPTSNSRLHPMPTFIPVDGSALDVMEASVDVSRATYQFTATYYGSQLGYFINMINGTHNNNTCYWMFYYKEPGSAQPVLSDVGVSNYHIPTNGYSVIMRYESITL